MFNFKEHRGYTIGADFPVAVDKKDLESYYRRLKKAALGTNVCCVTQFAAVGNDKRTEYLSYEGSKGDFISFFWRLLWTMRGCNAVSSSVIIECLIHTIFD